MAHVREELTLGSSPLLSGDLGPLELVLHLLPRRDVHAHTEHAASDALDLERDLRRLHPVKTSVDRPRLLRDEDRLPAVDYLPVGGEKALHLRWGHSATPAQLPQAGAGHLLDCQAIGARHGAVDQQPGALAI